MAKRSHQSPLDNHANQLNPLHPLHYRSQGMSWEEAEKAAQEARVKSDSPPMGGDAQKEKPAEHRKAG